MTLTAAGEVLAAEIAKFGPIPFSRFMEVALYHPEFGYYRRDRDPFGRSGDFYTAEQLQPVYGRLMARHLHMLAAEHGLPDPVTVVELGAGHGEMADTLKEFRYVPVDFRYGVMPDSIRGIFFSNEFFDAIPVDVVVSRGGVIHELRVTLEGSRFGWTDGPRASSAIAATFGEIEDGAMREVQTERLRWLDRIDARLNSGFIVTVDYGFTRRELIRFPEGTLMSYRRHQALSDVLSDPGERDISAHAPFTELEEHGRELGWITVSFESLARTLLRAGEPDQFAEALAGATPAESDRHRLQLKSLLVGMGETFHVLVQEKR